jgi:hypothetical protein
MRSVVLALLFSSLAGGAAAWSLGDAAALLKFETGFFSAALVLGASALGYWQMVAESAESAPHHTLPDIVESIDDRYGLWEEEVPSDEKEDVKTVLAREKARLKRSKRGLKSFLRSAKPAISLYRLGAYAVLVAGVFWLIRADLFEPVAYLAGAGLAPLVSALTLYLGRAAFTP